MRQARDTMAKNGIPIIKEIREAPVKSFPKSLKNWLKILDELGDQLLDLESNSPLVTDLGEHVHLYESLNRVMYALGDVHPGGLSSLRRELEDLQETRRVLPEV